MSNKAFIQSLTEDKCDYELGKKVRKHLEDLGIETPRNDEGLDLNQASAELSIGIRDAFQCMGLDIHDDSLADTPKRFACMLLGELTKGLHYEFFPKCTTVPNQFHYDQMVLVRDINIMSLCEHHLQTIDGVVHIAYLPSTKVLGLSKFARVADFFARRPQVQERLTAQISHALRFILETNDVGVIIKATHYCMKARGAMQANAQTVTDSMGGKFLSNPALRQEFLDGCR